MSRLRDKVRLVRTPIYQKGAGKIDARREYSSDGTRGGEIFPPPTYVYKTSLMPMPSICICLTGSLPLSNLYKTTQCRCASKANTCRLYQQQPTNNMLLLPSSSNNKNYNYNYNYNIGNMGNSNNNSRGGGGSKKRKKRHPRTLTEINE
eukprot:scaffold6438_cov231-Skeletonema_marinoi.AAC.1